MLAKFMFNVFCVAYCTVPYWMLDVNVPYNMFIAVPLTPVDASRDTPTLLLSNVRLTSPRVFAGPHALVRYVYCLSLFWSGLRLLS